MRPLSFDTFPHHVNCSLDILRGLISRWISIGLAHYWDIHLGKQCRFYGVPLYRRHPSSQIMVGDRCLFNSAPWSNYAGLNHPCILVTLSEGATLQIGHDSGFSGTSLGAATSIVIGNRVMAGANTSITDTDWHPIASTRRAAGEVGASAPVVIEDDVWLGANVMVLKGVTIGAETVIAANSVVTKSIPPRVVAGGNPARPLRNVEDLGRLVL